MRVCFPVCVGLTVASIASADTLILQERALDHPDGNINPPPYGLRLDGLFSQASDEGGFAGGVGGAGKDTTFSFSTNGAGVVVKVFEVVANQFRIEIAGTVFGGQDDGDDGNPDFGAGLYDIFMDYSFNVVEIADGWKVSPNSAQNAGWIRSQGNTDVAAGNKWLFYDRTDNNNNSFVLRSDNHRNPGIPHNFVGRGWNTLNSDGSKFGDSGTTQDWLFVTIPLPSGSAMALAGIGLVGLRRRR